MTQHSSRAARRFIPLSAIASAIVAIGLFVPSHMTSSANLTRTQALSARLQSQFHDAISADPDKGSLKREGPVANVAQYEYNERAFPAKDIPPSAYTIGTNQYNLVNNYLNGSDNWRLVGPTYAPGAVYHDVYTGAALAGASRVTAITADPNTCHVGGCNTIYVGAANGGVWKTTNGGTTWTPLFDKLFTNAVGAIAVDPVNSKIIYVGTGESNFGGDSNRGLGVYRSINGGSSWTQTGFNQFVNRGITSIIIDPRGAGNPSTTHLYVSDASGLAGGDATQESGSSAPYLPARGFYRSTNGGATWTQSNPTTNLGSAIYAASNMPSHTLVMDPSNPNILWIGFTSVGIFRSTNDGQTWTPYTANLPAVSNFTYGRYTLAIAPTDGNTLYVSYGDINEDQHWFKSTDAESATPTFAGFEAPDACGGQCAYDMPLAVSPTDANTLYSGGVETYNGYAFDGFDGPCSTLYPFPIASFCNTSLMKTTDGGETWADISANDRAGGEDYTGAGPLHPDAHAIFINPNDPSNIYFGNDGGVSVTTDATDQDPVWKDLNKGFSTLQFQGLAVGPTGSVYGGTQDDGTFRVDPGSTVAAHSFTGDGGQPMADPNDPNVAYYATYGTSLLRDDNVYCIGCDETTKLYQDFGSTITEIDDYDEQYPQTAFYQPHVIAPSQPSTIFVGTNRILRTLNRGGIDGNGSGYPDDSPLDSSDGASTDGSIPGNFVPLSTSSTFGAGSWISTMAVSPVDANFLAIATNTGRIYFTDNALANPTVDDPSKCDARFTSNHNLKCNYVSGINWTRIDNTSLPGRFPTSLTFAPGSTSKLYVTFSGFSVTTPGHSGHVFVTSNLSTTPGATSWTNLNGTSVTSLPDLPFSSIVVNPHSPAHLYTAGDVGVFFSPDSGKHWLRIDNGLPKVPIYQLDYDPTTRTLLAGTHGRAIWRGNAP